MNKCIQKILLAACIVVMPVTTHAGLIDHGTGYTRDSESNVVQGGGLEWLKWDETLGLSIDAALGAYAPQGWRLATNVEMAGLFNSFDFGFTFTAQEDVRQGTALAWDSRATGPHTDFVDLFGRTRLVERICADTSEACEPYEAAIALFGSDADNNNQFNLAFVDINGFSLGPTLVNRALFDTDIRLYSSAYSQPFYSVALVKSTPVTEPGTFALLSLGLLGLGLKRRIHRKSL